MKKGGGRAMSRAGSQWIQALGKVDKQCGRAQPGEERAESVLLMTRPPSMGAHTLESCMWEAR